MLHYNITKIIAITPMRFWLLSLLLFVPALAPADAVADALVETQSDTTHLRVIASIKPIHSLITGLMQGIGRPELLLASNQSPHHYSLKPSERRMLAGADLIFWIGPNMESFMPRLLSGFDQKAQIVSLIDTKGLTLHALRTPDHDSLNLQFSEQDKQRSRIDAHIWLNTHNVEIMIDEITQRLVNIDPDNAQQYKNNNKSMHVRVKALRNQLGVLLKEKQHPFLTYHDGYQYFEKEFNLKNAGFVSIDPELRPSAHHIQELKKVIYTHSIQCIFYDAPYAPPIMSSLLSDSPAQAIELDPTGIRLPAGEETLFQIMRDLGNKFQNCL